MSDSDYSEDMNLTIAYMSGVAKGKEEERAKIAAWLRVEIVGVYVNYKDAREIAQYIEAGEHLK